MRNALGIPAEAVVFGRHGGNDTFDIPFVRRAVVDVAAANPNKIYFVLLNTARLEWQAEIEAVGGGVVAAPHRANGLPANIIHLDTPLVDAADKAAFIRTCDAMLHARSSGETFGLAVAEFAAHGRPVLTSRVHHNGGLARFHIDVLGEAAMLYHDYESLVQLLTTFDRAAARRRAAEGFWQAPYRPFEPHRVMRTFRSVFLASAPAQPRAVATQTSKTDEGAPERA